MTATAIFVTYNSAAVIGAALASLPHGTPAIVVDNASADDSADIAERLGATVVRRMDNAGFGVANNDGLRAASTAYVLLLNPDARLRPEALERLLIAAESHPEGWLFVPTACRDDGTVFRKWNSPICDPAFQPKNNDDPEVRTISFASGAAIFARRERIVALNGFDPDIFLFFEDDDLSRRVLDAGGSILHVRDAMVDHAGAKSSPPSARMTEMKHWHMAWSERYVRIKHGLPVFSRWRVMESFVKLLWARILRNELEQAKQLGILNGTLSALRGIRAQDVRANITGGGAM